ncbi:MAG: hypothetical protein IKI11_11855, partial [Neisseriaceae bacterium]|nr:hypothetical protein [Neisseriaceae bacterium]
MNKVFKVVFNQITGTWVAVSEMAKSAGKKASVSLLPPPDDNHSQLVAHRSGSLNGFIRFAPLSLALMGVLGSTNLFAAQAYCYIDDTSKAFYCTGGTAAGDSSVSLGDQSKALGKYSISMGYYNTAEGDNSVSIGRASHAVGNSSSTLGYGNNAYSDYSSAVGYSNEASGQYSSALGNQSTASGNYATAIGFKSTASALSSTAIGYQSYAQSRNNTQLTGYSPAGTNNSSDTTGVWKATSAELAVGDPENKGSNGIITRQITGVAAGYKDTDAVNVAQLKEAGTAAQDWVDNQGFAKATDVTSQITAAGTAAQDWVNAQGFAKATDVATQITAAGTAAQD